MRHESDNNHVSINMTISLFLAFVYFIDYHRMDNKKYLHMIYFLNGVKAT